MSKPVFVRFTRQIDGKGEFFVGRNLDVIFDAVPLSEGVRRYERIIYEPPHAEEVTREVVKAFDFKRFSEVVLVEDGELPFLWLGIRP